MKRSHISAIHSVFWFIILSTNFSFLIFRGSEVPSESYIYITVKSLLEAADFYIFYLIFIPRFYKDRKFSRFILISVLYALTFIPIYAVTISYADILLGLSENWDSFKFQLIVATYYVILYIILGGLLKLALDGIKNRQEKIQLEKQNVKSELALLRSQINPHFLFNSLNTIHSYVNSQHEKASYSVILLSDIMRYMLYEAGKEKIRLNQEIDYLKSYIRLQSFRLEKNNFVDFRISGITDNIVIPPMLLTPFVENAFKHGKKRSNETGIEIDLEIKGADSLRFSIVNYIDDIKTIDLRRNKGVGLKNVKRRLELLFPEKHKLHISEKDNKFIVKLLIDLLW